MNFDGLAQSLDALSSSWGILTVLGIINLWAWTLIIITTINLRETIKGMRNDCVQDNIFANHARYCCTLAQSGLSARIRKRLTATHARQVVHTMAGRVSTILILASLAPLLGLLGTVDGVIVTFEALASLNEMGSEALTSGISKALITTQGGLLVAIPCLLAGGILYRKVRKLSNKLRLAALQGLAGDAELIRPGGA